MSAALSIEPQPRKLGPGFRRLPISWPADLFRSIAERAEAENISFSEVVRRMCQASVDAAAEGRGETAEARP